MWGDMANLQGAPVRDAQSKEGQGGDTAGLPKPNDYRFTVLAQSELPTVSVHELVLLLPMVKYHQCVSTR